MSGVLNLSRRGFLKTTGVASAFVLGAQVAPRSFFPQAQAATAKPNLFVSIDADGTVTITSNLDIMREIGASARHVLERAAAQKWGVSSRFFCQIQRTYLPIYSG